MTDGKRDISVFGADRRVVQQKSKEEVVQRRWGSRQIWKA